MTQLTKMMLTHEDSQRKSREFSTNLPWNFPVFAIAFALGKISRVVQFTPLRIRLTSTCRFKAAEECREAAHYLLRAAELFEEEHQTQELPS